MKTAKRVLCVVMTLLLLCAGSTSALALSTKMSITTSPGGTVFSGDSSISVRWDTVLGARKYLYSVYDATAYRYLYKSYATTGTSFSLAKTSLTYGDSYRITVTAYDASGRTQTRWTQTLSISVKPKAPTVQTLAVSNLSDKSVSLSLNVQYNGASITASGFQLGTSSVGMLSRYSLGALGKKSGTFQYNITGLKASTVYYYRAYATNSVGTVYGTTRSFTTKNTIISVALGRTSSSIAKGAELANKARSRIGTCESPANYVKDFFVWYYGDTAIRSVPWCAIFASWCAAQVGIPTSIIPKTAGAGTLATWFKAKGWFKSGNGSYIPKAGDLYFLPPTVANATASHVGIVVAATSSGFTTVDGNCDDQVKSVYRKYGSTILGFGVLVY